MAIRELVFSGLVAQVVRSYGEVGFKVVGTEPSASSGLCMKLPGEGCPPSSLSRVLAAETSTQNRGLFSHV